MFVLYCPNTILLHLFLKIFSTFKHLLLKGDIRSLCGTDSDAKLKFKSLNLYPNQYIEKFINFTFQLTMISCMCFKRKAYNLYSILTIFKPPESFDLYIVLRANGSDLEFHIKLKIRS